MNDATQIKRVSDFFSVSNDMKQRIGFTTSILVVAVLINAVLAYAITEVELFEMLLWSIAIVIWTLEHDKTKERHEAEARYIKWLSIQDIETLALMAKSPEIDRRSKRQIVNYLNTEKAGWSLV